METIKDFIRDLVSDDGFVAGDFVRRYVIGDHSRFGQTHMMHCYFTDDISRRCILNDNEKRLVSTNFQNEYVLIDNNGNSLVTVVCLLRYQYQVNSDSDRLVCANPDFTKLYYWTGEQVLSFDEVQRKLDE